MAAGRSRPAKVRRPEPASLSIQELQPVAGYTLGLRQPCVLLCLRESGAVPWSQLIERLHKLLAERLVGLAPITVEPLPDGGPRALTLLLRALLEGAGFTLAQDPRVLPVKQPSNAERRDGTRLWMLAIPCLTPAALPEPLRGLLALCCDLMRPAALAPEAARQRFDRIWQRLGAAAPGGTNNRHIIRTAYQQDIPVLALPGGVFQYGWGAQSRLLKSTISDATPAIGTVWAKDKRQTRALLHRAGLPVPKQVAVSTLPAAREAAARIGYPVVLKPACLDRGEGVESGLSNDTELDEAWGRASALTRELVVEQFITGEDYRIYVMGDEVLGVAHRIPARVTGDGTASIAELVDAVNRDSRRGEVSVYKPIRLDDEALHLLARAGLTPGSVLPAGQIQTLCRSANSSRGGVSLDVTASLHPDNAALAIRASRVLRLDIAGLDFLTPDISRSWREVGGAFCEVNAQPQMGGAQPWIFRNILRRLLPTQGRIPAVLVLGHDNDRIGAQLTHAFERRGLRAAVASAATGVALNRAVEALLLDPSVEALVVVSDGRDLLRSGLPLDRFDLLVVGPWRADSNSLASAIGLARRHVSAAVVALAGASPAATIETAAGALPVLWRETEESLVDEACTRALEAPLPGGLLTKTDHRFWA